MDMIWSDVDSQMTPHHATSRICVSAARIGWLGATAATYRRVLPTTPSQGGLFQLLSFSSSDLSLMLKKRFYLNKTNTTTHL